MNSRQWDQIYLGNDRFHEQPHPHLQKFLTLLKHRSAYKVIDLGCGSGNEIVELAKAGMNVLGLDFSPAAVDLAQKRLQEKGLRGRAAIADLHEEIKAIKEAEFDACLAINSLQYKSVAEFKSTLKEIRRILKTKGLLFLVVPSKEVKSKSASSGHRFTQQELESALGRHFAILELEPDENGNFTVTAEELAGVN
jgi:ubiquinone/menaquinone biosynthesis C-methylase UbiE